MSLFAYAPLHLSVSKVGEDGRGKDGRRKMEDGRRKTGEIPTARLSCAAIRMARPTGPAAAQGLWKNDGRPIEFTWHSG